MSLLEMSLEKQKVQNCVAPIAPLVCSCTTSVNFVSNNWSLKKKKKRRKKKEKRQKWHWKMKGSDDFLQTFASLSSNKARNVTCACEVKIVVWSCGSVLKKEKKKKIKK